MTNERTRRLFFALWPDRETRTAIRRATKEAVCRAGGRAVAPENYHLTLAFLGAQHESLLSAILETAAGIPPPCGKLELSRLGHFARARVLWFGPERTPPPLRRAARVLWDALTPLGIARERRAFAAHLTLARKVNRLPEAAVHPVAWRYAGFVLAESVTGAHGAHYTVVGEWPPLGEENGTVK